MDPVTGGGSGSGAPGPERPGPLPPALADRYRIGRVLGVGGMSVVYAAHDPLLRRDVAVKVFRSNAADPEQLRTQEAEARLVASLNHYALTTLFDAGLDASDPVRPQIYLVMEYIPGADLRQRLLTGPLTAAQVCQLGFDLAEGLDYVHEAGFVHHDLKPANVLLADRRESTRIRGKLTDFGVASIIGRPDTSEFTVGTAAYLSPEQVDGLDATPRSDVYALGLVLLEAVTGRVAYPGSVTQSAFARLDADPEIPEAVPGPLAEVLRAMTARAPRDRMPLKEVATRLQAILVDDSVAARETGPGALPTDEARRVSALRRYNVLDAPADQAFAAVTRLATRLLRTPIAVVAIADVDRVRFTSRRGVAVEQVERGFALCTPPSSGPGAWTVPDARADPRTARHPLVTGGPLLRAAAGAPLITRDGQYLGALCAFDTAARDFTPDELDDLLDLAGLVQRELELRLATRRAVLDR